MRPIAGLLLFALALLAPGTARAPPIMRPVQVHTVPCCVTHVGPGLNPAQFAAPRLSTPTVRPLDMSLHVQQGLSEPIYSLDPVAHPERTIDLPNGTQLVGREIAAWSGKIVVKSIEDAGVTSRAFEYLGERVDTPLTAISMLDPNADSPTLELARQKWGSGNFLDGLMTEKAIAAEFASRRNQRVVLYGHIETSENPDDGVAGARFVVHDLQGNIAQDQEGNQAVVTLARIKELARENQIEAWFVGCNSYAAGVAAGFLQTVYSGEMPGILSAMRMAATRGDFIAALGVGGRQVVLDPAQLVQDLAKGEAVVLRAGDALPVAIGVIAARTPPPPPSEEKVVQAPNVELNQQVELRTPESTPDKAPWWMVAIIVAGTLGVIWAGIAALRD